MKRILTILLACGMLLALASCSGDPAETSSVASQTQTSSSAPAAPSDEDSSEAPVSSEAPEEEDSLNLALDGTAYVDSVSTEYPQYVAENLNDGDNTGESRWQSAAYGGYETRNEDGSYDGEYQEAYCGIQWDEAQTFDTIVIDWETAHPTEEGFHVESSDDGETWEEVEFTNERTGTMTDGVLDKNHQIDTITFDPITAKYIRVVCTEAYNCEDGYKTKPSCWEFEVYNSADVEAAQEGTTSGEDTSETTAE